MDRNVSKKLQKWLDLGIGIGTFCGLPDESGFGLNR